MIERTDRLALLSAAFAAAYDLMSYLALATASAELGISKFETFLAFLILAGGVFLAASVLGGLIQLWPARPGFGPGPGACYSRPAL